MPSVEEDALEKEEQNKSHSDSDSDNESDEERDNSKMETILNDYENIKKNLQHASNKSKSNNYKGQEIRSNNKRSAEEKSAEERSGDYNEIVLSKSLTNNQIINLPKKTDKIKIKIKNKKKETGDNKLIVNMNTETIENKINFYKKINFDKCIDIKYLTKIWRNCFPEKTIFFSFNSMFKECNYNLLKYILNSYNTKNYSNITKDTIKNLLIKYYEKYANPKYYNNIHKLWKNQNKGNYNLIDSSIENIIRDENYKITAIDILLIAENLKIPIVIFYESKKNIKLVNFVENNKNKIYYFIKSASRYDKLYLTSCKKSLRFPFDKLKDPLQTALVNKTYLNFEDYLVSNS